MKKVKLLLLFLFAFMLNVNVFASSNTFIRTNDNLRVPNKTQVTQDKINSIMSTPSVSAKEKVYDFADLLTDAQEEELYQSLMEFSKQSGYDATIVTIDNLGSKENVTTYADDFYYYNDFSNEGIIFVIKKTDKTSIYMSPKVYVEDSELGYIYNQSRIQETLKYIYEHNIRNGDYYTACTNYVKILSGLYGNFGSGNYRVSSNGEIIRNIPWIAIITLSLTLTFIIVIILVTKFNTSKKVALADNVGKCVDTSSLFVKTIRDQLVDSTTEKR